MVLFPNIFLLLLLFFQEVVVESFLLPQTWKATTHERIIEKYTSFYHCKSTNNNNNIHTNPFHSYPDGNFVTSMSLFVNKNNNKNDSNDDKNIRDISKDGFGIFLPLADLVNDKTGGWGLSYADLSPETPRTPAGIAFLVTNLGYGIVGIVLGIQGDILFGTLTEIAGIVSFIYHYAQLEYGQERSEVRLALLTDYITASAALLVGLIYTIQILSSSSALMIPTSIIVAAVGSILCLSLSWVWEYGKPYLFWHSMWHILGAYTGFEIGQSHLLL